MGKYDKLTKFMPALDTDAIGEWVVEGGCARVEYWEVVFRFCDAVEDFCEEHPDFTEFADENADEAHWIVAKLLHAVREECRLTGLLYGYISNGTVREWLKKLAALED